MVDDPQSAHPADAEDTSFDDSRPARAAAGSAGGGSDNRTNPAGVAYRWGAAVFAVVSVVAVVVVGLSWSTQRRDAAERDYRGRVVKTAATWTATLINMNATNVDAGMSQLRSKTGGQLHGDFVTAMQPYRRVAEQLPAGATGRIESVAIVAQRYGPDGEPVSPGAVEHVPVAGARRSDPVMVVASTLVPNAGTQPGQSRNVRWTLQLEVSDVDGQLLVSRLGAS